jgi:VIT1/CCC1 family predicted Fe2+/Mn2+ transporter
MRASWKTGLSFGLTSGVITTLGLMVGLNSGTHSRPIVIGGILTIAIADAMSDALGIHVSEESKNSSPARLIWEATVATFLAKFVIALTFAVPVLVAPLDQAILISVMWGLFLLAGLSFFIARTQGIAPWKVIGEHLVIALCVVALTHAVGDWVRLYVADGRP